MSRAALPVLALFLSCAGEPAPAPEGSLLWMRTTWSKSRRQGDGATMNRVNSPDTATGRFKDRPEAKADGRLAFTIAEEPADLTGAELYLELWGGHPGTANKRFTLNGRGPYAIPEVGAAEGHCTYSYPAIRLEPADLRRGENVFQFACDKGSTFWGHFLFEIAALRLALRAAPFPVQLRPETLVDGERVELRLQGDLDAVASVEYEGSYRGYDENGDGDFAGFHGFTKEGRAEAILGRSDAPPFRVVWDTSMVPDQEEVSSRAVVRFKEDPALAVVLPGPPLPLARAEGRRVTLHRPASLPRPFWSRASQAKSCAIELDLEPAAIERAELHVTIWDGGRGKTADPFTLNGRPLPVVGAGRHDLLYRVVPVDPSWLRKGANEIRLLSDTEHHGIEVLLPGPALVVRSRR